MECDEWVVFYTCDSRLSAQMARGYLESEGVHCYLENENTGTAEYESGGPLRLLVPASQLALANELSDNPACSDEVVEDAYRRWEESGGAGRDRTAE